MKKHYHTLGLEEGASQEAIQEAYDKLSIELDPKNNDNQDFFVEEYAELQEAYKALTGKDPSDGEKDTSNNDSKKETLLSLMKAYKIASNDTKKSMISRLENEKKDNKIANEALAIIYKKGNLEKDKQQENSKPQESSPHVKDSKFNKKILLGFVSVLLLFLSTYIVFSLKVKKLNAVIPEIEKTALENSLKSKKYWEAKFFKDFPKIVAKHQSDDTNKGFLFNKSEEKYSKDTVVSFFIYVKHIKIKSYKKNFYKCVYYNAANSDAYWKHYVIGASNKSAKNKEGFPYFRMKRKLQKEFKISTKKYEVLLNIVGGLKAFHKKMNTDTDLVCEDCLSDYIGAYQLNFKAEESFYDFVYEYLLEESKLDKENKLATKKYKRSLGLLTKNYNSSVRKKLKEALKLERIHNVEEKSYTYDDPGLGKLTYVLKKDSYDIANLKEIAEEVYSDYFINKSLRNGAKPYSYCYGSYNSCDGYNCSTIKVKSGSSDAVVIVKKNGKVYRHAYVKAHNSYTLNVANGAYDVFFYSGKGWNSSKFMKNTSCGKLKGGFVSNENVIKKENLYLNNQSWTVTLYTVTDGTFKPKTSNVNEAL